MDLLSVAWISVPMIALSSAAIDDVRTREASDGYWMVVAVWGMAVCLLYDIGRGGIAAACFALLAKALLTVCFLSPKVTGWKVLIVMASAGVSVAMTYASDSEVGMPVAASITIVILYYAMYAAGRSVGGADVKCLMSLAVCFPVYPNDALLWESPDAVSSLLLSPSFSIFALALLLSMSSALITAIRNIRRGRICPSMFGTLRMDVSEAYGSFVWPVERIEGGAKIRCPSCIDDKVDVLDELRKAGHHTVLVTPMIPFLLPIAVAAGIILLFGNPIFALI